MENKQDPFRWVVAALLFLSILFMQMSYSCLPPLFSEISKDIPLDKAQMGMIFGMIPLAGVIFGLIGGALSDISGSRLAIGGALLIAAVFGGLRSFAASMTALASLTFIVGVGVALIPPNVAKVVGAWFPQSELGKANGIVLSAAPIGVGLGLATGSSVLSANFGGWRGAIDIVALICLLMGVVWMLVYREQKLEPASKDKMRNIPGNFRLVFAVRDVWLIAVFCGCLSFAMVSLMGLLPIVLEERGIGRAGEMASLFMLSGVLGSPLGGMASDKVGKRKPFFMVPAVVMAICIPFFLVLKGIPLMAALVVAGLASGVILPIMLTTLVESRRVSVSLIATTVGLVMTIGSAVGFLGPVVSGYLIDLNGSPWSAFVLISVALVISAGAVIPLEK